MDDLLLLYTFRLFPTRFVSIEDFFREIFDNYCITAAVLIDRKCLVCVCSDINLTQHRKHAFRGCPEN